MLLLLFASCSNNKLLFKNIPENLSIAMPDAIITNGDILDINIASLNRESTLIFSQNSNHNNWSQNLESRKIDGYLVDSSGYINMPIIGIIKASGLTCFEFSEFLKISLKEYVLNPSVRTKILNFRVSILGEVNRPGTFNVINQNISLTELISTAGGFTNNANPSKILIIRDANNEIETRYVDLTSYEFINSEYYFLKQNDEVYVKPDKASLAFDFGILRNIGSIALLATTLLLIFR
jgi:polysaccharide export outer membrane protein